MILYLDLGANLGEREKTLRRAIERIKKIPATKLLRARPFSSSEAVNDWKIFRRSLCPDVAEKFLSET